MYTRKLETYLNTITDRYRAITFIGPRQSGKTTLARNFFREYDYISFEDPDTRLRVQSDPKGFLRSIRRNCIIDEVQRFPEFLSYLQGILDDKSDPRKFVLTGSNSLLLSAKISQSLAGRARLLCVLPLQRDELPETERPQDIDTMLFCGSYPRIYDEKLEPTAWYGDYYQTYVEKDIRSLTHIENLAGFDRFVRLVAGRSGQLVNHSSLASDAGISSPTAKSWLSLLEASFICYTLQPHFRNFSKRIIKSPKVYFYDTGLLCYLLRIRDLKQLESHPLRGAIFENWVISEHFKNAFNLGREAPYYFWRDQHGHEVDLICDQGQILDLIEIKSGQTFHPDFLKNILWLGSLQGTHTGTLIYGGADSFEFKGYTIRSWDKLFQVAT